MTQGWNCPCCGKAHAPTVLTCPEPVRVGGQLYPSTRPPNYPNLLNPYRHDDNGSIFIPLTNEATS